MCQEPETPGVGEMSRFSQKKRRQDRWASRKQSMENEMSKFRPVKRKGCQEQVMSREHRMKRNWRHQRERGIQTNRWRQSCQQKRMSTDGRGRSAARPLWNSSDHFRIRSAFELTLHEFPVKARRHGKMALWRRSTLRWGLEPQDPAANSHEPYILPNTQIYLTSYRRFCILQYRFYSFWNVRPRLAGHYLYTKCEYGGVCSNTAIVSNASMCPMFQSFLVVLEPYLN